MNKKLKFSWSHIIAFVALIFYAYITFVGSTYLFNCRFWLAGIVTFGLVAIVFVLFMGVQQIKGTDENFTKSIKWERALMVFTIIFFCASLHPFLHTWHVQKNHSDVEKQFSESIKASRQLFEEYEKYSRNRLANYYDLMDGLIMNKVENSDDYNKFGFKDNYDIKQKALRLQTLKLQLLSSNYDQLKKKADDWIKSAGTKASIWNIFLVGNIDQINLAVNEWEYQLQSESFSGKVLADEEFDGRNHVSKFDEENKFLDNTLKGLDNLRSKFTNTGWPSMWGYITAILCYLALIFPYIIQPRHTKNWYRLFGYAQWYNRQNDIVSNISDESSKTTNSKRNAKKDSTKEISKDKKEGEDRIHFEGLDWI